MKKSYILILTLLLLNLGLALEITPKYNTNIIVKEYNNPIELTLKIENATPGNYNLYTLSDLSIQPSNIFQINQDPFEKTFTLTPTENLKVDGNYAFTYTLNHREEQKYEKRMLIKIKDLADLIEITSDSIDPSSKKISFYLENKENIALENLTATFSSIFFEETKTFSLSPNEKIKISVDPYQNILEKTTYGVYVITATLQTPMGEREIEGNLYIGEKKGITTTEDKFGILIQREIISKVNAGNTIENIEIKIKRNIFSRLFTTFNINPAMTQRDGMTIAYTWRKEKLNPSEAYTIKAQTNYILPFLIIILIGLTILGYTRYSQTKLEIEKSVSPVKTKNGEFALKVKLAIKARQNLENVTLIDKVPAIVKIYKKFGNVQPDKIEADSRRIHWKIGNLESGEERILDYIIYSKVGVVGKFSLPRALAVFEKEGNIHEVDSNNVFFMNEQAKEH